MLIRRKGEFAAEFHVDELTWRLTIPSRSVDLALYEDLTDQTGAGPRLLLTTYLSPRRFLNVRLIPDEARVYAARILKAADAAEKGGAK